MSRGFEMMANLAPPAAMTAPTGTGFGDAHVCILLALFNGAATLGEQLDSLAAQTHKDWSLIVSDDGSIDDWTGIVTAFADRHARGRSWLINGPRAGYAQNFLALARAAGPLVPHAAFCDQDDVWMPYKLARALAFLSAQPPGKAALYCSRTVICDKALTPARMSPLFRRRPGFANALVQNIGGGNTMVLNRAALDLVQDTAHLAKGVISHDWWCYQIVSGAGGAVHYDTTPTVLYRQHGGNLVGANDTLRAGLRRFRSALSGSYRAWNEGNVAALGNARHWLTDEASATLDAFADARRGPLGHRLRALGRAGVYRQRRRGDLALWAAAFLNRL